MRLLDGMHHCVDSSELAFYLASEGAMKQVYETGSWQLLEPVMSVEITCPEEFQVNIYFCYGIINCFIFM